MLTGLFASPDSEACEEYKKKGKRNVYTLFQHQSSLSYRNVSPRAFFVSHFPPPQGANLFQPSCLYPLILLLYIHALSAHAPPSHFVYPSIRPSSSYFLSRDYWVMDLRIFLQPQHWVIASIYLPSRQPPSRVFPLVTVTTYIFSLLCSPHPFHPSICFKYIYIFGYFDRSMDLRVFRSLTTAFLNSFHLYVCVTHPFYPFPNFRTPSTSALSCQVSIIADTDHIRSQIIVSSLISHTVSYFNRKSLSVFSFASEC